MQENRYSLDILKKLIVENKMTKMVDIAKAYKVSKQRISYVLEEEKIKDEVVMLLKEEKRKILVAQKDEIGEDLEGEIWVDYKEGVEGLENTKLKVSNMGRIYYMKEMNSTTLGKISYRKLVKVRISPTSQIPVFTIGYKSRSALKVFCEAFAKHPKYKKHLENYKNGRMKFSPVDENVLNLKMENIAFTERSNFAVAA